MTFCYLAHTYDRAYTNRNFVRKHTQLLIDRDTEILDFPKELSPVITPRAPGSVGAGNPLEIVAVGNVYTYERRHAIKPDSLESSESNAGFSNRESYSLGEAAPVAHTTQPLSRAGRTSHSHNSG